MSKFIFLNIFQILYLITYTFFFNDKWLSSGDPYYLKIVYILEYSNIYILYLTFLLNISLILFYF